MDKKACAECKRLLPPKELEEFEVPFNVSCAFGAETLGKVKVLLCERCLKKNGEPWKTYVSRIIYQTIPKVRVKVPRNPKVIALTVDPELFEFIKKGYPRCGDSEVMRRIFEYYVSMEDIRERIDREKEAKLFSRI